MKTKALTNWEVELAKQAEVAAGMEASTIGSSYFSLKSGVLSFQSAPLPNNQMAVVVADAIIENIHYPGKYDPNVSSAPDCFAFGRDERELKPHEDCVQAGTAQAEGCFGCRHNAWGSSGEGKGKACRNGRRLALLPAGQFTTADKFAPYLDEGHYKTNNFGFLRLPPTSIKNFAGYVRQLATILKRPPYAVFTKIRVVPDTKRQFSVTFEALGEVPEKLLGVMIQRHKEAMELIEQPYKLAEPTTVTKRGNTKATKVKVRF